MRLAVGPNSSSVRVATSDGRPGRERIGLEAQRRTHARIAFLIDKAKLLDRLRGDLNERQEKVLLRVLAEGPDGFEGGLSASITVSLLRGFRRPA